MKILSIDAWASPGGGWDWNQWFHVGDVDKAEFEKLDSNRKLIRFMRERGFLVPESKGQIAVEDDQYNIVFLWKNNREPMFAIEYGPEY
jgi:hypothetical protein